MARRLFVPGGGDLPGGADSGKVMKSTQGPQDEYVEGKKIGSGAQGVVVKVTRRRDGVQFAGKILQQGLGKREKIALQRLNSSSPSKFIIHLVDIASVIRHGAAKEVLILQLAYCNINQWAPYKAKLAIPDTVKLEMGRQAYAGLAYIHQHNLCHHDLNTLNVLICNVSGLVKIADFGNAKDLSAHPNPHHEQKLQDLRELAQRVIGWIWLGRRIGATDRFVKNFLNSQANLTLVDKQEVLGYIYDGLNITSPIIGKFKTDPDWFEKRPEKIRTAAVEALKADFINPEPAIVGGSKIPACVYDAFVKACLLAPLHLLTAQEVRDGFQLATTAREREDAVRFMKNRSI
eukprot:scpid90690/ scgid13506/ Mitogen-activated protein kinase kinase 2